MDPNHRIIAGSAGLCLAALAAFNGYQLWSSRQAHRTSQRSADLPLPLRSSTTPKAPTPQSPEDWRQGSQFACTGAYSNVEFSTDDEDGSGVYVRIAPGNRVVFTAWEGGPVSGRTTVLESSAKWLRMKITFSQSHGDASIATLTCENAGVRLKSTNWGDVALHRVSSKEAADLEG
jgi:hypothetical protein